MKAREIVFVIVVILLGLAVQSFVGFHPTDIIRIDGPRGDKYHEFVETKEADVDVSTPLRIENAYGDLSIRAWDQPRVSVQLRKRVYVKSEQEARAEAERIRIVIEEQAGDTFIGSNRAQSRFGAKFSTDFEITVPNGLSIRLSNDHGDVTLQGIKITDLLTEVTYGDLTMSDMAGRVEVKNDHSDVSVGTLDGSLFLHTTYGDPRIVRVTGDVQADSHHGDASAEEVGGRLELDADYADVRVRKVGKDAVLSGDHSSFQLTDCGGSATVRNSYERVRVAQVMGDVFVTADHSPLEIIDAGGAVKAKTSYEEVVCLGVKGQVEIDAEHSPVQLKNISSAVVQTSYEDVSVNGFSGKIDINAPHGSVAVRSRSPLSAPLSVRCDNGDIDLTLTPDTQCQLVAETLSGEIVTSMATNNAFRNVQNQRVSLTGSIGQGRGPMVELRTSYGDIRIRAAVGSSDDD